MEISEQLCRLCRRESGHLESLQGHREGLPISVIIMIIYPIKIESTDVLPKFVCGDCLEVVINAYKLREESLESDRYFRECVEGSLMEEEQEIRIKQEDGTFADALPLTDLMPQPRKKIKLEGRRLQLRKSINEVAEDLAEEVEFPFKVECHKKGLSKSSAWEYFGRLVHTTGDVVESEIGFYFCRLCVHTNRCIKTRYKAESISTGMIFTHLKTVHGIERDGFMNSEKSLLIRKPTEPKPIIQGLIFTCFEKGCSKAFKMKMCLEIHAAFDHAEEEEPMNTDFHVDITQAKDKQSMAWSYFGHLLNSNYELVDDLHNYCRICVGEGNLTKYLKSCSTTTLLHHVRDQHLQIKRKRKSFGNLKMSSITALKDDCS